MFKTSLQSSEIFQCFPSAVLTKPSRNNGKLADLTEKALKTSEPAVVTGKVHINVPGETVSMKKLDISDGQLGSIDVNDLLKNSMRKSLEQVRKSLKLIFNFFYYFFFLCRRSRDPLSTMIR